MRANGLTIPCTVGRPRDPVRFEGRSAEQSHLENWRVVSCLLLCREAWKRMLRVQRVSGAGRKGRLTSGWTPAGEVGGPSGRSQKARQADKWADVNRRVMRTSRRSQQVGGVSRRESAGECRGQERANGFAIHLL